MEKTKSKVQKVGLTSAERRDGTPKEGHAGAAGIWAPQIQKIWKSVSGECSNRLKRGDQVAVRVHASLKAFIHSVNNEQRDTIPGV